MPLDPSLAGRTYPPTNPYEVGREKIREFATAVGAADPAYRDPDMARSMGYPDIIAPPTFPIVLSMDAGKQIIDDPVLGIDYSRVVHGEQRFAYTRPVYAGDRLTCVCTLEEITSRGGHDFVTTRAEVATDGGEPVVTVWSKMVVRGEG
jgi:acyl dehydratase